MVKALKLVFLLLLVASVAHADDAIKEFTFRTVDGKTIDSRTYQGKPMVINVSAYW